MQYRINGCSVIRIGYSNSCLFTQSDILQLDVTWLYDCFEGSGNDTNIFDESVNHDTFNQNLDDIRMSLKELKDMKIPPCHTNIMVDEHTSVID